MNRSHHASKSSPNIERSWVRAIQIVAVTFLCLCLQPAGAADRKPSPPEMKFTFEALNVPNLSQNFLGAGASMMTLDFVDGSHLLISYSLRGLVPRLVGDSPDDDDRVVGAELVELPSGQILGKARWHMHDHGRYLWTLADGRFLLREGGDLYTFAPMANLASKNPFQRVPLPHRPGVLDAVVVSPDGKLLTIESHKPEPKKLTGININVLTNGDLPAHPLITYDFYRLSGTGGPDAPLTYSRAGSVAAPEALRLPLDANGYLVASDAKRGRWKIEYESFAGSKSINVGVVESNCQPGLQLVSATQYLAFTCRSARSDDVTVAAYDFAKNDIWEEPMGDFSLSAPVFAFAPAAGRFAISRKLDTPAPGIANDPNGTISTQEVRVYGTQSGDLLMKTYCVPVFRTSENFDISDDGMRLGVIRNGSIEIYRLPELTKTDRADLADLARLTPPTASGLLDLHRIARHTERGARESEGALAAAEVPEEEKPAPVSTDKAATATATSTPDATTPATPLPSTIASDAPGPAASPSGDLPIRRKPPTLLNPGETPETGTKPKREPN